jgi:hypothetical protein
VHGGWQGGAAAAGRVNQHLFVIDDVRYRTSKAATYRVRVAHPKFMMASPVSSEVLIVQPN